MEREMGTTHIGHLLQESAVDIQRFNLNLYHNLLCICRCIYIWC